MPRTRKTIKLLDLTNQVNAMLGASAPDRRQGREALAVLIEAILIENDAYAGFRFTDGQAGVLDPTRRRYYTSKLVTA